MEPCYHHSLFQRLVQQRKGGNSPKRRCWVVAKRWNVDASGRGGVINRYSGLDLEMLAVDRNRDAFLRQHHHLLLDLENI